MNRREDAEAALLQAQQGLAQIRQRRILLDSQEQTLLDQKAAAERAIQTITEAPCPTPSGTMDRSSHPAPSPGG